jgi:soluble P-type ATPase
MAPKIKKNTIEKVKNMADSTVKTEILKDIKKKNKKFVTK